MWKSVNLATDKVIDPLSRLAEAMHKHGAKIMIQATHMAVATAYHGEHWAAPDVPSGVREPVLAVTRRSLKWRRSSASFPTSPRPPSA